LFTADPERLCILQKLSKTDVTPLTALNGGAWMMGGRALVLCGRFRAYKFPERNAKERGVFVIAIRIIGGAVLRAKIAQYLISKVKNGSIVRHSICQWLGVTLLATLFWPGLAVSQNVDSNLPAPSESGGSTVTSSSPDSVQQPSKHVLWVIPNFRTSPPLEEYSPISPKEKFKLAAEDSFDRGTVALAAAFAGEAQITDATKSFGQGVAGYSRYFGTAYADFVIGNYMTEGIYPTILHQDPRYFPKLSGSGWSRLAYAIGQIFWTHKDSGGMQFNFSEWVGNSTAVAISQAYYPDNRTASNAISKLGAQIAVDTAANIVKEFWPDIERKLSRKHHEPTGDR
jgi:hypothetical protein